MLVRDLYYVHQWRIQDFSDEGDNSKGREGGSQAIISAIFSPKTAWDLNKLNRGGGGASLALYFDE